jgi:16S rRNA A1518/A1519 N6-dimethyltransferase RsmA/KsgA/DIM1 with predicted DNA glycosylase/AP lyase activity
MWLMEYMCGLVFSRRRKMMRVAARVLGDDADAVLTAANIPATARPEQACTHTPV